MRIRQSDRLTNMATINIVSFVDIVFTLLVIVMVIAPALHKSLNIQVPKTQTRGVNVSGKWIIGVADDGKIYLNERPIALDDLSNRMQIIAQSEPNIQVFIVGDHRTNYGYIIDVLDILKNSGINNVGMVTEPQARIR